MNQQLIDYVESEIIPRYRSFDKAHREDHARSVIERSLALVPNFPEVDPDMVYTIAAFHDLGLVNGRENHHHDSKAIVLSDRFLPQIFTPVQISVIADAVEDHRASNSKPPRSVYGMIVAEADRLIDPETIIRRTVQYGLAHYPEYDREGHYRRTLAHLKEKYGPDGYLKIWIPQSDNAMRLKEFHTIIADEQKLRNYFDRIFDYESTH